MRLRPIAAVALLVAVSGLLVGCSGDDGDDTASDTGSDVKTVECDYPEDAAGAAKEVDAPSADAPAEGTATVTLKTSVGDSTATLDQEATPCTAHSFVSLAEQGYFDATQCHRLTTMGIYVLQCGDPTATGTGGPGYSFKDELSGQETYPAGTLAMANAGPDTNGSQFFIVYQDTQLPPSYAVFGTVDDASLAAVQKVAEKGAQGGAPDGPPATPVEIESATVG